MNYSEELREAAREEPNTLTQKLMRDAADRLDAACSAFNTECRIDTLRNVVGAVAHGIRVMQKATPKVDPPASRGALDTPKTA
jgi:hypothetical protein